jgi:hypothetical protein
MHFGLVAPITAFSMVSKLVVRVIGYEVKRGRG